MGVFLIFRQTAAKFDPGLRQLQGSAPALHLCGGKRQLLANAGARIVMTADLGSNRQMHLRQLSLRRLRTRLRGCRQVLQASEQIKLPLRIDTHPITFCQRSLHYPVAIGLLPAATLITGLCGQRRVLLQPLLIKHRTRRLHIGPCLTNIVIMRKRTVDQLRQLLILKETPPLLWRCWLRLRTGEAGDMRIA